MTKELRRFTCEDDAGNRYTVVEYQETVRSSQIGDGLQTAGGASGFALANGEPVDYDDDDDTYVILRSGTIIRRV